MVPLRSGNSWMSVAPFRDLETDTTNSEGWGQSISISGLPPSTDLPSSLYLLGKCHPSPQPQKTPATQGRAWLSRVQTSISLSWPSPLEPQRRNPQTGIWAPACKTQQMNKQKNTGQGHGNSLCLKGSSVGTSEKVLGCRSLLIRV